MSEGTTPAATEAPASIATGAEPPAPTPPVTPPAGTIAAAADAPKPADGTAETAKAGAPEKYEAFTFPEGIVQDEKALAEFLPLAKDLNLTQEQAQKLVDFQSSAALAAQKASDAAWAECLGGWKAQVVADAELGGTNLQGTIAACGKAIAKFGSPTLRQTLETTGVGNHPDIVRFFAAVGKAVSEDKLHVANAEAPATEVDLAKRLFPNMK
jgi:hypothetical protein